MNDELVLEKNESRSINDKLIGKIKRGILHKHNISFDLIREHAKEENGIKDQLNWGKAILKSQDQLNQYLHTYGPMIKSQWKNTLSSVSLPDTEIQIIDYACGQGLGCSLFLDKFFKKSRLIVNKITLIEPSSIALSRALEVVQCYDENYFIDCINLKLDDLPEDYLVTLDGMTAIHIFSNILDIDTFDIFDLFRKILSNSGRHLFLAVSHDRNFDGGAPRLEDLYNAFNCKSNAHIFKEIKSEIRRFNCSNGMPAICFNIEVEV